MEIENIPTIVNLVESSCGARRYGVVIYAMLLMKLSERCSAINMVHKTHRNGCPFWNKASEMSNVVTVLFFGGPDDRAVLACGLRMAEHPGISLTALHFASHSGRKLMECDGDASGIPSEWLMPRRSTILKKRQYMLCNLFLVSQAPPVLALTERSNCPELAPVESYLASAEFSMTISMIHQD